MIRLLCALLITLPLFSAPVFAQDTAPSIVVTHPWARSTPPVARTGAVYLSIQNVSDSGDRLIDAQAGVSDRAEIHITETTDGVSRMRQVRTVDVGPGATVTFSPGKLHVMLVGLKAPLVAGQTFPLELLFEKAGSVKALVEVAGAGAAPSAHGH